MMRWLPLFVLMPLLGLSGCGSKYETVSGVLTLDGKPVADATVTFVSDDGKSTAFGMSDASGNFTLASAGTAGVIAGNYKVVVTKSARVAGGAETMNPGVDGGSMSKDYIKQMSKEMDKNKSGASKMGPGGGSKSELPAMYASAETTPLTAKVPTDGPVKIEMKSKQ